MITTHVLWASDNVPHPICVLGDVNSFKGAAKLWTHTAAARGHDHIRMFPTIPSIYILRPKFDIPNVVKCIISVNGTEWKRNPVSVGRRTNNANARKQTRKRR